MTRDREQFKRGLALAGRVHVEIFGRVRSRSEPTAKIQRITVIAGIFRDEVVFAVG
jgi:hypothetical protein